MAQMTLHDYLQETEDAIAAGRLDDALAHCQQILAQFPGSLEANRLLGEVYLAQGRLEEARQSFDWVLMNDPENVVAYCNRALVCQKMSDVDTALDCYQQAYELSGGDGTIRRQFNQLSAQIGQPPFMYSRAGLARLYMRGDLLSHALLEWEAVLAVMPDRLDARLGLLEAYWRKGDEEKVAQLSAQIVEDVPECLKALVLLAYTTAPRNSQRALELLQRAQALDPEMVMAQELFADTMASQPAHPFFMLWKKTPVLIDLSGSLQPQPGVYIAPVSSSAAQPVPTDSFSSWSDLGNWGSLDTLVPQKQEQPVKQEASVLSSWGNAEGEGVEPWRALEQRQAPVNGSVVSNSPSGAAWSFDLEQIANRENMDVPAQATSSFAGLTSFAQTSASALSWEQPEPFSDGRFWENAAGEAKDEPVPDVYSLSPSLGSSASSNPPSWLNMLAQSETSKGEPIAMAPAEVAPLVSAQSKQAVQDEQLEGETKSPVVKQSAAESVIRPVKTEESPFSWGNESADEEETFGFGPEWLKTLGATTLNDTEAEEAPREEARQVPTFSNERSVAEEGPSGQVTQEVNLRDVWPQQPAVAFEDWTKQITQTSQAAEGVAPSETVAEELTTLESLEQRLHAQGFVPLEPNTLSTIAQSEEVISDERIEPEVREEEQSKRVPRVEEKVERDFSLSSALAQFGPLPAEQAPVMPSIPATPVVPELPVSAPPVVPAEPIRVAARQQPAEPVVSLSTTASTSNIADDQRRERLVPSETGKQRQYEAKVPIVPAPAQAEVTKVPAARAEGLMDSELEMTMRRPAVRVQSMSSRGSSNRGRGTASPTSGNIREALPGEPQGQGSAANYREHLVRGYQHQLVGDYDEAMQEYRLLIRNAPELLGEVVSNVRALLKLAPKYSAGYRVLGDAYMRQGEYLQAMEAYNKALTMAKKARGMN